MVTADTLNTDLLRDDPKTMDEHSEESVDLTDLDASSMHMDGDSEESQSLNTLEEEYAQLKKKVRQKMDQLGKRVLLCIMDQIATDYESDHKDLLVACVGINYDILERQFRRFMLEARFLFKGLVVQELAPFRNGNEDTENYLMDSIEFLAERDFKMLKGFEILKRKVAFYVQNPKVFEDFLEITDDILKGWDAFLRMMVKLKVDVKHEIRDRLIRREEMLAQFFEKDKAETESAKSENLQIGEAGDSEKNGMNEFQELQEENRDQEAAEESGDSSFFTDTSPGAEEEGSGQGEGSEEDGKESGDMSTAQLSSEESESELEKTSESQTEEEEGDADEDEQDKAKDGAKEEKKEPGTERRLADRDEDAPLGEAPGSDKN